MLIHVGRKKGEKELGGLALKLLLLVASERKEMVAGVMDNRWRI